MIYTPYILFAYSISKFKQEKAWTRKKYTMKGRIFQKNAQKKQKCKKKDAKKGRGCKL